MDILDQIDPHLTSEDTIIRNFALHVVRSFPSYKPEWPERLIRAAMQDSKDISSYLLAAKKMNFEDQDFPLLFEAASEAPANKQHLYANIFKKLPLETLVDHREQLGNLYSNDEWELLAHLKDAGKDELDSMLQTVSEKLEANRQLDFFLYSDAKQIAQRQVEQGFVHAAGLHRILEESKKQAWMPISGIIAVYQAGLLKDRNLIDELAELFGRDEDLLQEEIAAALIAFQSDEAVRAVEPFARSEDAIFPINVIAGTYSDYAIATLKKLYADTDDADHQSFIVKGLAEQLAAEGRTEIEHFMTEVFRPNIFDNEEMAYGYFKIMGFDHPELGQWERKALKSHAHFLKVSNKPLPSAAKKWAESSPSFSASKEQAVSDKVGRNDPCPCGSGKKYKKCHGI